MSAFGQACMSVIDLAEVPTYSWEFRQLYPKWLVDVTFPLHGLRHFANDAQGTFPMLAFRFTIKSELSSLTPVPRVPLSGAQLVGKDYAAAARLLVGPVYRWSS